MCEGARQVLSCDRPFTLIEELDVTTERDGGHDVLDAVGTRDAGDERPAETDREAQHLEPEAPRDPEMAELVHRHQKADGDYEPYEIPDETHA